MKNENLRYANPNLHLRMSGSEEVEGILVPFATRNDDKYGTWWSRESDFALHLYQPHALLFWHGLDLSRYGSLVEFELRAAGLYARGRIGDDADKSGNMRGLIQEGRAAWSSATMPHLLRVDRASGYVSKWPIVEGSILDVERAGARFGLTAASFRRVFSGVDLPEDASFIRSHWIGEGFIMPENGQATESTPAPQNGTPAAPAVAPAAAPAPQSVTIPREQWDSIQATLGRINEFMAEPPTARVPGGGENPVRANQPAMNISVASKWDQVSLLGMLMRDMVLKAYSFKRQEFYKRDEEFLRAMVDKGRKLYEAEERQGETLTPREIDHDIMNVPMRVWQPGVFQAWHERVPYLRADEAMKSTLATFGDELVPTLMENAVWFYFRLESRVASAFRMFDLPSVPFDWPKITSGTAFRLKTEITDVANATWAASVYNFTKLGTDKITYNPGEIAAATLFSDRLLRDAGIPVLDAFGTEYVRGLAAAFDDVMINGDETADITNISHLGTDPTGTAYDRYLAVDGLRHIARTATDEVAEATVDENTPGVLRRLMGARGILGHDIRNLVMFVDPGVKYVIDDLAAYESLMDVGPQATLLTGAVGALKGVPITVSDEMEYTNVTGELEDSHDGTKGMEIVCHRPSILIGRAKEGSLINNEYVPAADGHVIYAKVRADIQSHETGAVAVGFNSTV